MHELDVRHHAGDYNDVDGSVAHHLICDIDVATECVARIRQGPVGPVGAKAHLRTSKQRRSLAVFEFADLSLRIRGHTRGREGLRTDRQIAWWFFE